MPSLPVAVFGAGAVGCYIGGMLARAGVRVMFIGRPRQVEAMARDGLLLDTLRFRERIAVEATTAPAAAGDAAVILFCVKTLDTESAAVTLAPHITSGTAVVSLQNGVDNASRIRAASGVDAISAAVYVAASMTGPGALRHTGRGDLVLDERPASPRIAEMFESAGVPCRISENVEGELWTKLVMNCAYNAISALARARYGTAARDPLARDLMRRVVEETVAVARAAGVRLPDGDLWAEAAKLGVAMEGAISSTAQDIARGRLTEIDSLNGYVARRGAALGVDTPVNATLHALVKLLESRDDVSAVFG
jgi:2-dehydropantoate 2-reductase